MKGSFTGPSLDDIPVSWAGSLFIQQQFGIPIQRKIAAREAYTTDIGPFGRQCVLACLVA